MDNELGMDIPLTKNDLELEGADTNNNIVEAQPPSAHTEPKGISDPELEAPSLTVQSSEKKRKADDMEEMPPQLAPSDPVTAVPNETELTEPKSKNAVTSEKEATGSETGDVSTDNSAKTPTATNTLGLNMQAEEAFKAQVEGMLWMYRKKRGPNKKQAVNAAGPNGVATESK